MLVIGTMAAVLALELFAVGWAASSLRRLLRPTLVEAFDLLMVAVYVIGAGQLLTAVCTLGLSIQIGNVSRWLVGHAPHLGLTGLAGAVAFLVLTDFCLYWSHRALHTRWLWPFHSTHHSPDEINAATVYRHNPVELVLDPLAGVLPSVVVGAAQPWFLPLLLAHTALLHSAVRWDYGWVGRWLWNSPLAHRIHHSKRPEHVDKNFGTFLPIWDRLFGTWFPAHQEKDCETPEVQVTLV